MQEFNKQNINYLKEDDILMMFLTFLAGSSSGIILANLTEKLFKLRKEAKVLKKDLQRKSFKDVESKKVIEKIQEESFKKNRLYNDLIILFYNRLKEKKPNSEFPLFFNNLKDLLIINYNFSKNKSVTSITLGGYHSEKNYLLLNEKEVNKIIFHELFHVASSCNIKNDNDIITFCGFHQEKNDKGIGLGLNEGYTEVLVKRYFPDFETINAYKTEVVIAKSLELIIGQELMEDFYFTANLQGLIKELTKYISLDEIMDFITKFDFLHSYINLKNTDILTRMMLKRSLLVINKFLINCYYNKLKEEFNQGKITEEDFNKSLHMFLNNLLFKFFVINNNKNYSISINNKKIIKKIKY